MSVIIVKIGRRFYKAKVNPGRGSLLDDVRYIQLCRTYVKYSKAGNLRGMIRIERQIKRLEARAEKNPLIKSRSRASVGKNIKYLMHHPGELTARGKANKRKQAVAIALSVWRRASGIKQKRRTHA